MGTSHSTNQNTNQQPSTCLQQTLTHQMRASLARSPTRSRTPPTTSPRPSRATLLRPARRPTRVCFTHSKHDQIMTNNLTEQAKGNVGDTTMSGRASGALGAASDKFDQTKHESAGKGQQGGYLSLSLFTHHLRR